jgi:hypothetical protein
LARTYALQTGIIECQGIIHEVSVTGLKCRLSEAETVRQAAENLSIRESFPYGRNDGLSPLQKMLAVGGVEIRVFKM